MSVLPRVSVVIPAHNPAPERLRRTLAALAGQTLPESEREAILVDNASRRALTAAEWTGHYPGVRIVPERRLGLVHARAAGIEAARAEAIVFVDDDNVLNPEYLERVAELFAGRPDVGVAGGRIVPEFAVPPPRWSEPHLQLLALRDHGPQPLFSAHRGGRIEAYDTFAPLGAGLAVRTVWAREYVQSLRSNPALEVGRSGRALTSCDECDLVMVALRGGAQMAYLPGLQVTHLIPAGRLRFSYLVRLNHDGALTWSQFRIRNGFARPIPRWTVPLRQARAFFVRRGWTRSGFVDWRGACGLFTGLARP